MSEIETFLDELSSAAPVPGGGSVAALQTAMAASLLAMVANLTLGKKRYESVQDQVLDVKSRAVRLRDEALLLVEEDVAAYSRVTEALALPRDSDEQKQARRRRLQEAFKTAAGPPLRTMQVAAQILELAQQLVRIGNRSAISDVGTAALAARAGYHAGRLNVDINLNGIADEKWVQGVRQTMAHLPDPDGAEAAVLARVSDVIVGEAG